jgi:hypothetical protein
MVLGLIEAALVLLVISMLALGAWAFWRAFSGPRPIGSPGSVGALPPGPRAELAAAIAAARWAPAHDEVDGTTRVLVRKTYTALDGRPEVLEERVLTTFPSTDPEWEVRFIEGMSQARFRCTYLNAEEQGP